MFFFYISYPFFIFSFFFSNKFFGYITKKVKTTTTTTHTIIKSEESTTQNFRVFQHTFIEKPNLFFRKGKWLASEKRKKNLNAIYFSVYLANVRTLIYFSSFFLKNIISYLLSLFGFILKQKSKYFYYLKTKQCSLK